MVNRVAPSEAALARLIGGFAFLASRSQHLCLSLRGVKHLHLTRWNRRASLCDHLISMVDIARFSEWKPYLGGSIHCMWVSSNMHKTPPYDFYLLASVSTWHALLLREPPGDWRTRLGEPVTLSEVDLRSNRRDWEEWLFIYYLALRYIVLNIPLWSLFSPFW